jgi:1-deoxy-D-xylulose-5-phosphate synthase
METITIGTAQVLQRGSEVAVLSLGTIADKVQVALDTINRDDQITHVDLRFLKPLDEKILHGICQTHKAIVTVEDGILNGGVASAISEFVTAHGYDAVIKSHGINDQFVSHGKPEELHKLCGLNPEAIIKTIIDLLE